MNSRGVAAKLPVLLGGAALTRSYVENDLSEVYEGRVDYARDAFEGLRLMDATMARARGGAPAVDPAEEAKRAERKARHERSRRVAARRRAAEAESAGPVPGALGRRDSTTRSRPRRSGARGSSRVSPWPSTPGWSTSGRCSSDSGACAAAAPGPVDTRSWWSPRAGPGCGTGWTGWPPRACCRPPPWCTATSRLSSEGDALVVLDGPQPDAGELQPLHLPAPAPGPAPVPGRLLAAPRARAVAHGEVDVLPLHLVTMGQPIADYANELFAKDAYRDYLEVHGLGRAAHRGAGRVLAPAHPRGADVPDGRDRRRRRPRGRRGVLQARLSRRALLAGLRGLPEPRRPHQDRRPAAARPDRRRRCPRSCSCTPSSPRTRSWHTTRRPSTSMPADDPVSAAVLWDMDGTLIDSERLWDVSLPAPSASSAASSAPAARARRRRRRLDRASSCCSATSACDATPERIAWTYDRLVALTEELFVDGDVEWQPGARAALRPRARGRGADGAGDQQPARITELALDGIGRESSTSPSAATRSTAASRRPIPTCAPRSCSSVPIAACVAVEDSPNGALAAERAGAAVLVVPCEVPVPPGPRRTHRVELVGLTAPNSPQRRIVRVTGDGARGTTSVRVA